MSKKPTVPICSCDLENGYILKNFFAFNDVRGRPIITFQSKYLLACNRTADDQLYAKSYLHGDEVKLTWDQNIPEAEKNLSLTFDSISVQTIISKIKKKDKARLYIFQYRNENDAGNFSGENSLNDFAIYFSSGSGGDEREGLRHIIATRVQPDITQLKYPDPVKASTLIIPIKVFKQMIDSFTKCKKESIKICFYNSGGKLGTSIMTEVGGQRGDIFEKFGDVPDEGNHLWGLQQNKSLENGPHFVVEAPNEFTFAADKIPVFSKFASMHIEGSVRICYQESCHLRIAHRFGAFGECEIVLCNTFTKA